MSLVCRMRITKIKKEKLNVLLEKSGRYLSEACFPSPSPQGPTFVEIKVRAVAKREPTAPWFKCYDVRAQERGWILSEGRASSLLHSQSENCQSDCLGIASRVSQITRAIKESIITNDHFILFCLLKYLDVRLNLLFCYWHATTEATTRMIV